jgi:hypothetical protein
MVGEHIARGHRGNAETCAGGVGPSLTVAWVRKGNAQDVRVQGYGACASGAQAIAHRHQEGIRCERLGEPSHHRRIQPARQRSSLIRMQGRWGTWVPQRCREGISLADLEVEVEGLGAQALPERLCLRHVGSGEDLIALAAEHFHQERLHAGIVLLQAEGDPLHERG